MRDAENGMQTRWNRAALNPLVCKILVGTVAAGFLAVVIFHQPWFPVEISHAETGILVAESASTSPTLNWNAPQSSEDATSQKGETSVPRVQSPKKKNQKEPNHFRLRQTAEVSISHPKATLKTPAPSFSEHIAPLLRKHCLDCHDDGELDFTHGDRVTAFAPKIAEATASREMPPWKAKAGFGAFQNDLRLSDAEIDLIQRWVKSGSSRSNAKTGQKIPTKIWKLGKPSVAYQLPQPFEVPATDSGLQWNFVIPTGVKRELFLTGLELRPGNKNLVQRMVLSYDATGTARQNDEQTPKVGFPSREKIAVASSLILGEWTPGMTTWPLPKDSAYRIPKGADLVLTVDYAPTSEPALDPWTMGLHVTRNAPKHRLGRLEVAVTQIPSNELKRTERSGISSYKLPTDAVLYSLTPGLSDEGSSIRVLAETPNGQVIPLVEIENWESRWNNRYIFSQPIQLPKDSRLIIQTRDSPLLKLGLNRPSGFCQFEVSTPNPAHIEPLLQHNASTQ